MESILEVDFKLFTKSVFCKECYIFVLYFSGQMDNPKKSPNGRNVKSTEKGTANSHERRKDFLSESEMKVLLGFAKKSRYPKRNYLLLLMIYRHGLRVSEAIQLKRTDINIKESRIWVSRLKNGLSVEHPISGDELRAIKGYFASRKDNLP
ncbi:Type 1 fimbriae regulatory protein, FimB/FimE family [hydrothermal vent metagenome]|uniref:Type 1 fimbriae regulatory protein, FimB/FimE family n=1 Tax=hydrothermal vent metagenome TaxID=652676 RepID=A0A3B0TAF2_9ZZZZ